MNIFKKISNLIVWIFFNILNNILDWCMSYLHNLIHYNSNANNWVKRIVANDESSPIFLEEVNNTLKIYIFNYCH